MKKMFELQKKFGKHFRDYPSDINEKKTLILAIQNEIHELLDTLPWKDHRKWQIEKKENQLEELVDIFKYWIELVMAFGFEWDDIEREFYRKSAVVEQRYKQEFINKLENVVIVDIDGVLSDYPFGFTKMMFGKEVSSLKTNDIIRELGIDYQTYREVKEMWRTNGGYKKLNVDLVGKSIVNWLRSKFSVVIVSNRPFHKYKSIYADTLEWLVENEIPFDALLFAESEKVDVLKHISREKIVFAIEDDPAQIEIYKHNNIPVVAPNRLYLKNVNIPKYQDFNDFLKISSNFLLLK